MIAGTPLIHRVAIVLVTIIMTVVGLIFGNGGV
jgi:hypothetical protein